MLNDEMLPAGAGDEEVGFVMARIVLDPVRRAFISVPLEGETLFLTEDDMRLVELAITSLVETRVEQAETAAAEAFRAALRAGNEVPA